MTAHPEKLSSEPTGTFAASTLLATSLVASLIVLSQLTFASVLRSPLSAPADSIDFKREILAGSDALLERMVIPPNRPDWVVMDCAGHAEPVTVFDQVRASLCELKRD